MGGKKKKSNRRKNNYYTERQDFSEEDDDEEADMFQMKPRKKGKQRTIAFPSERDDHYFPKWNHGMGRDNEEYNLYMPPPGHVRSKKKHGTMAKKKKYHGYNDESEESDEMSDEDILNHKKKKS